MADASLDLYHGYLEQFLSCPYFSFPLWEVVFLTDCLHCAVAIILGQGRQIVKIQPENPERKGRKRRARVKHLPVRNWCQIQSGI